MNRWMTTIIQLPHDAMSCGRAMIAASESGHRMVIFTMMIKMTKNSISSTIRTLMMLVRSSAISINDTNITTGSQRKSQCDDWSYCLAERSEDSAFVHFVGCAKASPQRGHVVGSGKVPVCSHAMLLPASDVRFYFC